MSGAWTRRALLATTCLLPRLAEAGNWPERPVRIITFGAPGGGMDAVARHLAEALSRRWGQTVIVDNRPGADGILATEAFLASARDLHTLLYSSTSVWTVLPLMNERLPFDPARDMLPISLVVQDYIALGAAPRLGVQTMGELIAHARARREPLNATVVPGAPYLCLMALQREAGIELNLVSYRNPFAALPDLTQGRIELAMLPLSGMLPQAQAGALRLLAVASAERVPAAPELPTAAEQGFPNVSMDAGNAMYGPKEMPPALRERIAADIRAVATEPALAQKLTGLGYRVRAGTPAELATALEEQRARWSAMVRTHGVRPQ